MSLGLVISPISCAAVLAAELHALFIRHHNVHPAGYASMIEQKRRGHGRMFGGDCHDLDRSNTVNKLDETKKKKYGQVFE